MLKTRTAMTTATSIHPFKSDAMNKRLNIASGTNWEAIAGYSRAVKIGNVVEVAGTTAVSDSHIVGKHNHYEQTVFILQKIELALKEAGATLNDVIRTRIFITDILKWEAVAKAHGEFFGKIKPACTLVQVSALIHPDLLVEIEASAVLTEKPLG